MQAENLLPGSVLVVKLGTCVPVLSSAVLGTRG